MRHHAVLRVPAGFEPSSLRRHLRAEGFGIAGKSVLVPLPAGASQAFSHASVVEAIGRNDPVHGSGEGVIVMGFEDFDEAGAGRLASVMRKLEASGVIGAWESVGEAHLESFPLAPAAPEPVPSALPDPSELQWKLASSPFALPIVFAAGDDPRRIEIDRGRVSLTGPGGACDLLAGEDADPVLLRSLFAGEAGRLREMIIVHERTLSLLPALAEPLAMPSPQDLLDASWSVREARPEGARLEARVGEARVRAHLKADQGGIAIDMVNPNPLSRVPLLALESVPGPGGLALAGALVRAIARHDWQGGVDSGFDHVSFLRGLGVEAPHPLRTRGVYAVLRDPGAPHDIAELVRRGGFAPGPVSPSMKYPSSEGKAFEAARAISNIEALGPYPGGNGVDLVFFEIENPIGAEVYLDLLASHDMILAWDNVPEEMLVLLDEVVAVEMERSRRPEDRTEMEIIPGAH